MSELRFLSFKAARFMWMRDMIKHTLLFVVSNRKRCHHSLVPTIGIYNSSRSEAKFAKEIQNLSSTNLFRIHSPVITQAILILSHHGSEAQHSALILLYQRLHQY